MDGYRTLKPEQIVEFEIAISEKSGKPQAENVVVVE
jgi:cold shock CspA family protein